MRTKREDMSMNDRSGAIRRFSVLVLAVILATVCLPAPGYAEDKQIILSLEQDDPEIRVNTTLHFSITGDPMDDYSVMIVTPESRQVFLNGSETDYTVTMPGLHTAIAYGHIAGRDEIYMSEMLSFTAKAERVTGRRKIIFWDDDTPKKKQFTIDFTTDMFLQDTTEFHQDIAKLAVLLASNAYNKDDNNPGIQIVDMYHALGIDDDHIMLFNYQGHPLNVRNDPLSDNYDEFSIASRSMGDYELLLITLRGSGGLDWLMDLDTASITRMNAKVSEAFYFFMEKVYDGISRYLWEHPEISKAMKNDELKVLITGHSRGGAAANLLGAFLMDTMFKTDNPIYTAGMDDTFVYTFACPRVMHKKIGSNPNKTSCRNIINIVINFDPVPKLFKDLIIRWKRYGTTYTYKTTYNNYINDDPRNHKPYNYIRAVFDHDWIKKQADKIGTVIVSSDP